MTRLLFLDSPDSKDSLTALGELENIDDDTDNLGVALVKTSDVGIARDYGVKTLPALIYFEHGEPSVYDGALHRV